jgi:hypothetical protein
LKIQPCFRPGAEGRANHHGRLGRDALPAMDDLIHRPERPAADLGEVALHPIAGLQPLDNQTIVVIAPRIMENG